MPAGRPRSFDPDQALDQILNLFWRKGFEASGMAEILEVSGMARQSLYNTFGDKKKLFLTALSRYTQTRHEFLRSRLNGASAFDSVCDTVFGEVEGSGSMAPYGCMIVNVAAEFGHTDALISKAIREYHSELETMIREALERAQSEGDMAPHVNPSRAARGIANALNGLTLMRRAGFDQVAIRDAAESALDSLTPPV